MNTGLANVASIPAAHAAELSPEDCDQQVRRIAQSSTFRNATTLQALLQFITSKTLAGESDSLKEYTIGVEALGRKPDFDPKIDPIVRVQSHRLRVKLKEYYETEGRNDPIRIQFPKGHYVPVFESALPSPTEHAENDSEGKLNSSIEQVGVEPASIEVTPGEGPARQERSGPPGRWLIVAVLASLAIALAAGLLLGHWHARKQAQSAATSPYDPEVVSFWSRIVGNDPTPVIAYPDAVFLLDDSNDLFRFRRGATDSRGALVDPHVAREFAANPELVSQAGKLYYENGYTGTGELESVAVLAGLLGRMGLRPIIKSSRDVLPEDLSQHTVILLGSPFQNPAVAQLMTAGDFRFNNPDEHHEQWRAQILNTHPGPGEAPVYGTERDAASRVLTADYGVITLARSGSTSRWIAILGGLDTKGTEGSAMFLTSKAGVERLNQALVGHSNNRDLFPFQALVRVDLAKGYLVMNAEMVAMHPIPVPRHPTTNPPVAAD